MFAFWRLWVWSDSTCSTCACMDLKMHCFITRKLLWFYLSKVQIQFNSVLIKSKPSMIHIQKLFTLLIVSVSLLIRHDLTFDLAWSGGCKEDSEQMFGSFKSCRPGPLCWGQGLNGFTSTSFSKSSIDHSRTYSILTKLFFQLLKAFWGKKKTF